MSDFGKALKDAIRNYEVRTNRHWNPDWEPKSYCGVSMPSKNRGRDPDPNNIPLRYRENIRVMRAIISDSSCDVELLDKIHEYMRSDKFPADSHFFWVSLDVRSSTLRHFIARVLNKPEYSKAQLIKNKYYTEASSVPIHLRLMRGQELITGILENLHLTTIDQKEKIEGLERKVIEMREIFQSFILGSAYEDGDTSEMEDYLENEDINDVGDDDEAEAESEDTNAPRYQR